jgi:hypothetical protein
MPRATESSPTASPPSETAGANAPPTGANAAPAPTHAYDNPSIGALEFLYAVMRDPHTSLRWRVEAADRLMRIDPNGYVARQEHASTVISMGGIRKFDA